MIRIAFVAFVVLAPALVLRVCRPGRTPRRAPPSWFDIVRAPARRRR